MASKDACVPRISPIPPRNDSPSRHHGIGRLHRDGAVVRAATMPDPELLDDADYETLAAVRAELRSFAHFTEKVAQAAGLSAQQHQVLVALRASKGGALTIGALADTLLLKPHSVTGLADRLEALGLVERVRSERDRRSVELRLTDKARRLMASLSRTHRDELRRIRPLLISLLSQLD